ncbi:hypothetical protein RR46_08396 [Papilio xuthus]|nr:hypothetical protein RR46_08396 [Papilio xuthus]
MPVRPVSPPSPVAVPLKVPTIKITDDDEERLNQSMQYSNIVVACPPAVDRALKPRHSSHSIGNMNNLGMQSMSAAIEREELEREERRSDIAQGGVSYANANYFEPPSPTQSSSAVLECKVHGKRKLEEERREHVYMNLVSFIRRSPPQLHKALQFNSDRRSDVLQYLDLDLHTAVPPSYGDKRRTIEAMHGKSWSSVEASSAYKTVDFLKTEAFNITRQDAEASRNSQY